MRNTGLDEAQAGIKIAPWWFANFLFFIIQSGFIKMFFVPVLNTGTNVNSSKFITGSYQDN